MPLSRLNLDQIRAFLAVVRLGGVRKAAQALYLSQPAVSARLKNLEDSLSQPLFERSGGGLKLTKAGELFLGHAERFEHLSALVEKDIVDPAGIEGYLRIGASETITQCWLPDFIARLHQQLPRLQVEINVDISVNLRAALLNREIDLAFLLGPISEYTVANIELPAFELAWYVAADRPEDDPTAYLQLPVITYLRQTRPYRELKTALLERVGPGVVIFPSSSLSASFRLVEVGIGVAALPRAMARPFLTRGSIREFDPGWRPAPLQFSASYLAEPGSPTLDIAIDMALAAAQDFEMIEKSDH